MTTKLGRSFNKLAVIFGAALCFNTALQAQDDLSPAALTQFPTTSWPTNGGDLYNRRFSPLTEINKDNVANLKGVWRTHLNGSGMGPRHSGEAAPIVYNGVAYVITGDDDVFALSIKTGEILWETKGNLNFLISTVCCGWTSRGVGMGDGRIYVGQLDGKLKALDMKTGAVVWEVQAEKWEEGYTITGAPLFYDGLVITGFAGGERGIRGRVKAYNATTGAEVWAFNNVPGPGEFGHDTWPQDNTIWMDGGASMWQTPAVDPELGLLYYSTGNAGPDFNGRVRKGNNLFTASILALDAHTGEYKWHFQEVHHDIWDYDAPNPVILFDIEIDGVERKALSQAGKTGWLYILDRVTGAPLIGINETAVPQEPNQYTSATQPIPVGDAFVPQAMRIAPEGYPLKNGGEIFTPFWLDPTVMAPGVAGGANWPPSSHDPRTGYTYICGADKPFVFQSIDISTERPEPGSNYTGGEFKGEPLHNLGVITAMDMHTNKIVWQFLWNEPCFSGMTTTASDLLFVGRNDGRLVALDSANGMQLWEFQTGAGMNAPVSIFEFEGKQYVLAYSAGNALAPSPHGDSLWLFSLDGNMDEAEPANATPVSTAGEDDAATVADGEPDLDAGLVVYRSACVACHGDDGRGGHGGGIDLVNANDFAMVVTTVSQGRNNMPALGAVFTAEQLRDVAGYVSKRIAKQP
ncbi:MAG: PQQ-binding-like beta-propeller repeat protein [Pseudomonadota bacterium]